MSSSEIKVVNTVNNSGITSTNRAFNLIENQAQQTKTQAETDKITVKFNQEKDHWDIYPDINSSKLRSQQTKTKQINNKLLDYIKKNISLLPVYFIMFPMFIPFSQNVLKNCFSNKGLEDKSLQSLQRVHSSAAEESAAKTTPQNRESTGKHSHNAPMFINESSINVNGNADNFSIINMINSNAAISSSSFLSNSAAQNTEINPDYRFAHKYSIQDIMSNPQKADEFKKDYLMQEAEYFAIARNPENMMTYDGYALDPKTGEPTKVRDWSAPSKECLDMGILIKALTGDPAASLVVGKGDINKAKEIAADILDKKMDTYLSFNKEYPGYGGMLPWFKTADDGKSIVPTDDWEGKIPGLDNGQWLWTMLVAEKVLRDQGHEEIADKYKGYLDNVKDKITDMFYDEKAGKIRADVVVTDPKSPHSKYETIEKGKGAQYLSGEDTVHEGSMMVLFATLFGKGLPEDAAQRIWNNTEMTRIEHKYGTTWQGCWGSAHESWAYLFLPNRDMKEFNDLFRIREVIRTQNAAERGYPGFASSTNKPGDECAYLDGEGIEGVGILDVGRNDTFTLYGAFPLLLEFSDKDESEGNYGLAWLLNMLKAPAMQGPLGGGESAFNDGTAVSYMKTIDGSFPNVLAMAGGLSKETADTLKQYGKYEQFKKIMLNEYYEAFGEKPLNEPCGFTLPSKTVPVDKMKDFE